jgi:hypothetical protein
VLLLACDRQKTCVSVDCPDRRLANRQAICHALENTLFLLKTNFQIKVKSIEPLLLEVDRQWGCCFKTTRFMVGSEVIYNAI